MLADYFPILIFLALALGFALVTIVLSSLLGRKRPTLTKLMPYECGVDPFGTARQRFSVRFFLVAMLFIVFDIEAVFLYPWAVIYRDLKLFGFVEMGIFILVLVVGLAYVWRKGALEWA